MLLSRAQVQQLLNNLLELGPRRLMALGLIGFAVLVTVVGGAYYLSRPEFETLYTGLSREDVTRIGAALREQNITFDVNTAGDAVSVRPSQTMQARMLLAEKGLPTSANSGYELFDKIGSLGLTSFMQEVTKLRALEGEIARTVQLMKGVKAARVHIVMPVRGSFRATQQPPSASVVLRTDGAIEARTAQSIRHLVAAAIPGMSRDKVTVLDADGSMLLAEEDEASCGADQDGEPAEDGRRDGAGEHPQGADAVSGPRQFRGERRAAALHRQAADQRDGLRPGKPRRAFGPERPREGDVAERGPFDADHGAAEPSGPAGE